MNCSPDNLIKTLWLTRPDLREMAGEALDAFENLVAFRMTTEYPGLDAWVHEVKAPQWDAVEEGPAPADQWPRFNGLMRITWQARPDLQGAFDIDTADGRAALARWFIFNGFTETGLASLMGERFRRELNAPLAATEQPAPVTEAGKRPLSRLMHEIWHAREDLQALFPLNEEDGHQGFMAWFYVAGLAELNLATLIDRDTADWLLDLAPPLPVPPDPAAPEPEPAPEPDPEPGLIQRLFQSIGGTAKPPPVPEPAPAPEPPLKPRLFHWWLHYHPAQRDLGERLDAEQARAWLLGEGACQHPVFARLRELTLPKAPPSASRSQDKPHGINLIGYAKGQFGIGEDVRMAARACQAAGIDFTIYSIAPGQEVEQNDSSAAEFVTNRLPYAVNLICTTGIETALMLARIGPQLFTGHYNIGYWPWELPEWPAAWHHAYELVDEVWASSRYAYQAFQHSAPVPVRHMPMAVTVEQSEGLSRADFKLPETDFLFVYGFDFLSYPSRKNPFAAIEAFKQAFPEGNEAVGLVIKVMRAEQRPDDWQALQAAMAEDPRIHTLADTLSRGALLDLYRACNAFVSLHRSEGFGRNIAEAMCLEKPVIVTGHSGNMDFTTPATAALVEHRMIPLGADDYPFGEGQHWADPSLEHAASQMARLVNDPGHAARLARNARQWVSSMCDPAVIGAEYRHVLTQAVIPRLAKARHDPGAKAQRPDTATPEPATSEPASTDTAKDPK